MNPACSTSGPARRPPVPIAILGVPFDPVTTPQTIELIADMVASRRPHYAVTANVDFVVQAQGDVELRRILFDAHLVLCDGMPLVWASRFLGRPLPERVTGSDLMPRLLAESERRGWRVFFLGGSPDSVAQAATRTLERHPRLRLVGAYSPPFKPLLEMDHADLLRRVTAAAPDLLFVAFGCPKQEKWINMHYRHLGVPVCLGVGATIDFIAGTFLRAPVWMQRTGTEWLFRLAQEPRRLAGRYGKGFWVFGRAIFAQWRQLRSRPARPGADAASGEWRMANGGAPLMRGQEAARAGIASTEAPVTSAPQSTSRVLEAPVRLDAATAETVAPAWLDAIDAGPLTLDLGHTAFIDSTGVGLLMRLRKRGVEGGHSFQLAHVQPPVERALSLMRIEGFFARAPALPPSSPGPAAACPSAAAFEAVADPTGLHLTWRGEITAASLPVVAEEAEPRVANLPAGSQAIIDLAAVTFIDSSGLGLMLGFKKRARLRDAAVTFQNPSAAVRNVARLARLEEYLFSHTP